ncbi:cell division protein [Streptomyces sp. KS_5]|uniref:cell division protein n=1 Tax=Streptomyces TaxID=1883 RepID=UPI00115FCFB6|nr:cell division protein [Streptomyces sp. KS_5]
MTEWAKTKRHIAEEITLLCPTHHSEKTRGLLPVADVIAANKNPRNMRFGISKHLPLRYSGNSLLINMGTNRFISNFEHNATVTPLTVKGYPVFKVTKEEEQLLLTLRVFDRQGNLLIDIEENELVFSASTWDIELVGKRLTIRGGLGNILAEMEFHTPSAIVITRGIFSHEGFQVEVHPDHIYLEEYRTRIERNVTRQYSGGFFFS